MLELIRIYFFSIRRNPVFEDKIIIKTLTFIGLIYFLVCLVFMGFYLDQILLLIDSKTSPIDIFSRFFLFIFVVDIILKFFVKSNGQIDIFPFLTLPVPRKKIYRLLFVKELFSKWNFIWVVLLTPFFFNTMYHANGFSSVLLLVLSIYFISVSISFVIRYTDVLSNWKSFTYNSIPLLLTVIAGCLAYYVAVASRLLVNINWIFSQHRFWVFIALIILFLCLFFIFQKFCRQELYVQLTGKKKSILSLNFGLFNKYGLRGEIIKLCLKEFLRSALKRNILLSFFFFIYGFFVLNPIHEHYFIRCIFATVPSILFGFTLAQLSFSIESTFFDKLMSSPKKIPYSILQTKYAICVLFSLFYMSIYSLVFFGKIPLLFWISIFFFECGFLFFIFQNVVYNKQRIDLFAVPKFSNSSIIDFLTTGSMFVLLGIAYLIYRLTSETITEYFMLTTGIIIMASSPFWLRNIYKRFLVRKYQNMEGFRIIL